MGRIGFLTALVLVTSSAVMSEANTKFDTEAPIEVQEACMKWGGCIRYMPGASTSYLLERKQV